MRDRGLHEGGSQADLVASSASREASPNRRLLAADDSFLSRRLVHILADMVQASLDLSNDYRYANQRGSAHPTEVPDMSEEVPAPGRQTEVLQPRLQAKGVPSTSQGTKNG
jgi:hypothetical protein